MAERAVLCNMRRNAVITHPLLEISHNPYSLQAGLQQVRQPKGSKAH